MQRTILPMTIQQIIKPTFSVIGKAGSTDDGADFIAALWQDANAHFDEIAHLAKQTEDGALCGIWGAMSDMAMTFAPWENGFSRGRYLAGVECEDDCVPPAGWTKWRIPPNTYLRVKNDAEDVFPRMLAYLRENGYVLAGAVHDFTDPADGAAYLYFPVMKEG